MRVAHGDRQRSVAEDLLQLFISLRYQRLRHACVHRVANEFTCNRILYAGQVAPPLTGRDVRDVSLPSFVRTGRRKGLVQQIFRHWQVMVRVVVALNLHFCWQRDASSRRKRTMRSRQAGKPCAISSGCMQSGPYVRRLCMNSFDGHFQEQIVLRSLRQLGVDLGIKPQRDAPKTRHSMVTGYSSRNVSNLSLIAARSAGLLAAPAGEWA